MKYVFFLHSAGPQEQPGEGSYGLVTNLIQELGNEYKVLHPIMPHPGDPDYEPWKQALVPQLAKLSGDVILIGHSVGGSVLLKTLAEEKFNFNIAGMFLVATPYWGMVDWEYDMFELPSDYLAKLPQIEQVFLYHSKQDQGVPFAHSERYAAEFPKATLRAYEGDDHAFEEGLPALVQDIKNLG